MIKAINSHIYFKGSKPIPNYHIVHKRPLTRQHNTAQVQPLRYTLDVPSYYASTSVQENEENKARTPTVRQKA